MALLTRVHRGSEGPELTQRDLFDSMLSRFFGGFEPIGRGEFLAPYAVDVREDADHIYVEAEPE